ncbi:MAG: GNAT family N-acetyltransferase [Myxococcota bacterium]
MELRVRAAAARDREAVLAVNAEGLPGVTPLSAAEVEACIERAALFRVAERAGSLCGYLIAFAAGLREIGDEYAWFSARHASFLYVDQVAVASRAQRSGVGSALYGDLEREARRQAIPRIVCEVNLRPPNPRSLAFHAARGFAEVGRMEVSDGRSVSLLSRELAQSLK